MSAGINRTAPCADAREPMAAALDFLVEASNVIDNRAAERDHANGERSMMRCVDMFNAWRGDAGGGLGMLSEVEGWIFMACLKLARAKGGSYRRDDFIDATAYLSLAGEAAEREATAFDAVARARGQ